MEFCPLDLPTQRDESMQIGELARSTGVKIETIRYYEREHLLPVPQLSADNEVGRSAPMATTASIRRGMWSSCALSATAEAWI